jgi:hypothetical protein
MRVGLVGHKCTSNTYTTLEMKAHKACLKRMV